MYNNQILKGRIKAAYIHFGFGLALFLVALWDSGGEFLNIFILIGIGQMIRGLFQVYHGRLNKRTGYVKIENGRISRNTYYTSSMAIDEIEYWKDFAGDITFVNNQKKELVIQKEVLASESLASLYSFLVKAPFPEKKV